MASGTLETDTGVSGTFVHFAKVVVTVVKCPLWLQCLHVYLQLVALF